MKLNTMEKSLKKCLSLLLLVALSFAVLGLSKPEAAYANEEYLSVKTNSVLVNDIFIEKAKSLALMEKYSLVNAVLNDQIEMAGYFDELNDFWQTQNKAEAFKQTMHAVENIKEVAEKNQEQQTKATPVNAGKGKTIEKTKEPVTDSKGNYLGNFVITAYCNCTKCQGKWVGKTASGKPPKVGITIAVDPKVIPLGTKINISGLGSRVAQDTGGKIKGKRIDVYMSNHQEALNWGKRTLEVWSAK